MTDKQTLKQKIYLRRNKFKNKFKFFNFKATQIYIIFFKFFFDFLKTLKLCTEIIIFRFEKSTEEIFKK